MIRVTKGLPTSAHRPGRDYSTVVRLRDGRSICLRAIRPDDKLRLLGFFSRLSARSIYRRFFGFKERLTPGDLVQLTELDFVQGVALVATRGEAEQERIVAVGRYFVEAAAPGAPRHAEVAFAVEDAEQGRGIAPLLLEHLVPFARHGGIHLLFGDVLAENDHMRRVLSRKGFTVTSVQHGVVRMSLKLAAGPHRQRS